jgi:hypothetical protein
MACGGIEHDLFVSQTSPAKACCASRLLDLVQMLRLACLCGCGRFHEPELNYNKPNTFIVDKMQNRSKRNRFIKKFCWDTWHTYLVVYFHLLNVTGFIFSPYTYMIVLDKSTIEFLRSRQPGFNSPHRQGCFPRHHIQACSAAYPSCCSVGIGGF